MVEQVKESTSAIEVYLHPLVIINISDHLTRAKVQSVNLKTMPRCIGILYGTQVGKRVELRTSFEIVYEGTNEDVHIDLTYVDRKLKDYAQVYPGYELLGWYATGKTMEKADIQIHKQILSLNLNDSPLYLQLDSISLQNMEDLPISIFEAPMTSEGDKDKWSWASVPYYIETELSEQIAVENIIRATASTKQSELILHYAKLRKAIELLKSKIDILKKYVIAVNNNEIERDECMLRTIKGLIHRFPSIESVTFSQEYDNEVNEVLMMTQLATITKGTKNLNELIDHWNMTYQVKKTNFF